MKKFLIAGSSLAAVAAAGSAGAVDVTLGGSIDMGVEFGVGKSQNDLQVGSAYNSISLSLAAAGTTDGGMKYGGSFTLATAGEIELSAYDNNGAKSLVKATVDGATDIEAAVYAVSGGAALVADDIVAVKINSAWRSVGGTQTAYGLGGIGFNSSNICKLAGRGTVGSSTVFLNGTMAAGAASGAYLPAGQVMKTSATPVAPGASGTASVAAAPSVVALTVNGATAGITQGATAQGANPADAAASITVVARAAKGAVDFDGAAGPLAPVTGAAIYAGPFMEVQLASSSTKMVVGAVCVEGVANSSTKFYLNNASKIVTASDASIYIEGGFGKLTLQTGDYSGGVSAIGSAGDEAGIDAEGLVAIIEGVGLLGANPFVAIDLAPTTASAGVQSLSNLEILTGGSIDVGGLSAAIDVALNSSDVLAVSSWDLGLNYSMGDMALAFAYDSGNDWGLSASMAVAGFAVDATFASDAAGAHEKSGISYSVAASTSLNGFGLSLGVDQDMEPTVSLSKSMGGLSLYAGYDAADEGGKVGATLSF